MKKIKKLYFDAISIRRCGGISETRLGISIVFREKKRDRTGRDYVIIISPSIGRGKVKTVDSLVLTSTLMRLIDCTPNKVLESLKEYPDQIECTFKGRKLISFKIGEEVFKEDNK